MPFISVKLDAKESKTAPEGRYPLRVVKCDEKKTGPKSKHPGEVYYGVTIANESPDGDFMPVFWNCMLPQGEDEQIDRLRKLEIQRFLAQFNIAGDANGFDTDDFVGSTAEGLITIGTDDKDQPRNELRLDRLDDGEEETKPTRGRRGRRGSGDDADAEIPF